MSNEKDIKQLNSFLRGEISATETYRQVIDKAEDASIASALMAGHASHQRRVTTLTNKVREIGGEPETDSGAWGAFAKAVEGGAKLFGLSVAVSVLEEGEDHGKKDYADRVSDLSPALQAFVRTELMPEQQRTHDALSALESRIS